jgi:hypothetical protein
VHRWRGADDGVEAKFVALTAPERLDLPPQPARLQGLLDQKGDLVDIERLVDVVVRPQLHGLDGAFDRRIGRHQDHQRVGIVIFDALEDLEAVRIGQAVIEQHQIGRRLELRAGVFSRRRLQHVVPLAAQPLAQRPANQRFVVDDQNGGVCHLPLV